MLRSVLNNTAALDCLLGIASAKRVWYFAARQCSGRWSGFSFGYEVGPHEVQPAKPDDCCASCPALSFVCMGLRRGGWGVLAAPCARNSWSSRQRSLLGRSDSRVFDYRHGHCFRRASGSFGRIKRTRICRGRACSRHCCFVRLFCRQPSFLAPAPNPPKP